MARAGPALGLAAVAAVAVTGAVVGYAAERALLHRRLKAPPLPGPPLGSLAGDLREVRGPDGLRVVTESYGPEDAPQIVLVHGWVCTGRVWHEQVVGLADRFRLITYDQPGHGRTSRPRSGDYDLDLFGDTLLAVIEEVANPGPLVLAGHSLGGMAILNALGRQGGELSDRIAGVALLSTTSRAKTERLSLGLGIQGAARLEGWVRRVSPLLRRPAVAEVTGRVYAASTDLSYVLTRRLSVGPDASPHVVDFIEQLALDSDLDMILGLSGAVLGMDEDAGLASLEVPTAIVVGENDRITPVGLSRRMADRSPGADLVVLPGIGHLIPLEAPAAVNEVLERLATGKADHSLTAGDPGPAKRRQGAA